MDYLFLTLGLVILVVSGELLVRGAVELALKFNISRLVIGMTIVSFGTSAPELLVSMQAALSGHPDIAIGNVVGSNIANISLILGITVLIFPLAVHRDSIRIDWPMTMIASVLIYVFMLNFKVEPFEGFVLVSILSGFVIWLVRKSRKKNKAENEENQIIEKFSMWSLARSVVLVLLGCGGLVWGGKWLLDGAVGIATDFGISERIIGVTLVAFGTSIPELITSVVAAFKKESDISVGNLIGSNLFNILGILGITSLVKEIPVSAETMNFDILWMLGITALLFPFMYFGMKFTRLKGVVLLSAYLMYVFLLF